MGIAQARNAWWHDVLEYGPALALRAAFDIDWNPVKRELADKVLLPILGDQYGAVLDAGQLRLERDGGRFRVRYYDTVAARRAALVHAHPRAIGLDDARRRAGRGASGRARAEGARHVVRDAAAADRRRRAARARRTATRRLDALARATRRTSATSSTRTWRSSTARPATRAASTGSTRCSASRPTAWRSGAWRARRSTTGASSTSTSWRRSAWRCREVFAAAHRLLFRFVRDGIVTGLRIDHPDGLYRPAEYFRRLQRGAFLELCHGLARGAAAGEWRDQDRAGQVRPVAGGGRRARAAVLHRRGEDPGARRAAAGDVGRRRHDGLRVPEPPERHLRRPHQRARHRPALRARDPRRARTSREIVYESKRLIMDTRDGVRAERARPSPEPDLREAPLLARLHARQPRGARCARSSRRSPSTARTSATTRAEAGSVGKPPSAAATDARRGVHRARGRLRQAAHAGHRRRRSTTGSRTSSRCACPRGRTSRPRASASTSSCASSS